MPIRSSGGRRRGELRRGDDPLPQTPSDGDDAEEYFRHTDYWLAWSRVPM
jgi:hypothetical protein